MGSFVITLREGFEAALIIGLILAYLTKTGQVSRKPAVWWGAGAALLASVAVGVILFASSAELEGTAEAVFEGTAMLLAAAVVTTMAFWMRRQAATIGSDLRNRVDESLRDNGSLALGGVAFLGVAREGLETALFLFASAEDDGALAVVGGALGLAAAAGLGVAFYRGALRLDLRRFFTITSVLVIAFAAYLIYGGIHELGEAAGSELLEGAAPLVAGLYGLGFAALYLRDGLRSRRAEIGIAPQAQEPDAERA